MAYRNGIAFSNIPFEQRCPPPRCRKREPLTRADRLVLTLCGSLLGLFLWTTSYMIMISAALKVEAKASRHSATTVDRDPLDRLPPYWWGVWPALAFAGFGSIVGAERMMDGFESCMGGLGKVSEGVSRS